MHITPCRQHARLTTTQTHCRAHTAGTARTAVSGVAAVGVGGAVAYAGSQVTQKRGVGAGVELWNAMAESEDPEQLDEEAIAAIMKRYGKTPQSVPGISSTYFNYLMVRTDCFHTRGMRIA